MAVRHRRAVNNYCVARKTSSDNEEERGKWQCSHSKPTRPWGRAQQGTWVTKLLRWACTEGGEMMSKKTASIHVITHTLREKLKYVTIPNGCFELKPGYRNIFDTITGMGGGGKFQEYLSKTKFLKKCFGLHFCIGEKSASGKKTNWPNRVFQTEYINPPQNSSPTRRVGGFCGVYLPKRARQLFFQSIILKELFFVFKEFCLKKPRRGEGALVSPRIAPVQKKIHNNFFCQIGVKFTPSSIQ